MDKPTRDYAIIPDLPENYISVIEKVYVNNIIIDKNLKINKEKNIVNLERNLSSSSVVASQP